MKLKKLLLYAIIYFISFDLLLIPFSVAESYLNPPVAVSLILFPVIAFAASFIYGIRQGFTALYCIMVGAFLLPSAILFYSKNTVAFFGFYLLISIIAMALGNLIRRSKR